MSKTATKTSAYEGLSDILGAGFDSALTRDDTEFVVKLDDIEIVEQVREEMETAEDSLQDLGASLQGRQLQPIGVQIRDVGPKPYRLIWGERRVRAARLVGMTELLAKGYRISDDEAQTLQFAENVQRKNLTQIEEAKGLQRELDALGSTAALLAKHNKSESWLSKRLALLRLPEQAARLVKESVSADIEVINAVRLIEKADPAAAKEAVDELKATRGKVQARKVVERVREKVKPSKPKAAKGAVATPRDRRDQEPSAGRVQAGDPAIRRGQAAAADAYMAVYEGGKSPAGVVGKLGAAAKADLHNWLATYFDAGKKERGDVGRKVIEGLRSGAFAADGAGALGLVAFLQGLERGASFDVARVIGAVKE